MDSIYTPRLKALRNSCNTHGIDNLIIFGFENIRYLCGFSGNAAYLIVTPLQNYLITDYRYYERAKFESHHCEVVCRDREAQSLGKCFAQFLATGKTGFESAFVTVQMWQDIASALTQQELYPVQGLVEALRMVKDDWEIKSIKKAAALADTALCEVLKQVRLGVTERDLATELDYTMKKLGSDGVSFDTILLFGRRSALPHGKPDDTKLAHQDFILIDFGAVINGYRSDMTRTYVFGEPSKQQQHMFDTVLAAQQAALGKAKAGISCQTLNEISQQVLFSNGYEEYAGKGLGHGLGLFLHEAPFINQSTQYTLCRGNVITIEPGVYLPSLGGVRIEDDILITEQGYECLTHAPKSFVLS
ncbi:aminopeptidase P family protein [Pseudoalteromonas sp. JBTF-M23]|uniref:Aminopeptidase P family protein n=1 Tax=Pseudoalteromonas caenipelagi TaxID=2726988 RepID=A0A849V9E9_9GAMM|nr:Xaa-Pro peptidase family protein [Pseudoalteromonas caenipelagi]NOU49263.1 aminopeptidase P family protein [Pseudoalteromonas caenipelagi]